MGSLLKSTLNTRVLPAGDRRFIRSDFPRYLTDDEVEWFRKSDVTTIVDLRGDAEHENEPCRLEDEEGFTYYHMPVAGNGDMPRTPEEVPDVYIKMIDEQMDRIIDTIMNAKSRVLFFCNAGKDRTGIVSALIMKRLGADDQTIIDDYMETRDNLKDFLKAYVDEHPGVDLNVITPCEMYMRKVLEYLDQNPVC